MQYTSLRDAVYSAHLVRGRRARTACSIDRRRRVVKVMVTNIDVGPLVRSLEVRFFATEGFNHFTTKLQLRIFWSSRLTRQTTRYPPRAGNCVLMLSASTAL